MYQDPFLESDQRPASLPESAGISKNFLCFIRRIYMQITRNLDNMQASDSDPKDVTCVPGS